MATGDTLRRITTQDQWVLDAQGNLAGLKNPNANGADLRAVVPYAWASRPATGNLSDRIRITDLGVAGANVVWDGTAWIPDGPQLLSRSSVAVVVTGGTGETTVATVTIPAGAMSLNGGVHVYTSWTYTNSANNKTLRARLGGVSGSAHMAVVQTTTATLHDFRRIRNRGSAASQVGSMAASAGSTFTAAGSALSTSTIDTSVSADLVISGQLALGTESITLESYEVWLVP